MSTAPPVIEVRLDRCPLRQPVMVLRVEGAQEDGGVDGEDAERLERLGVCPGRRVQLVRVGDPLILRVHGTRLGISARLAERVWVEPCTRCGDVGGVEGAARVER